MTTKTPKWSKKTYELVAKVLKQEKPSTMLMIASRFAVEFEADNPKFCRERFFIACGRDD